MKSVLLSGSPRANVGKKDAKASRAAGQVPCVLYGGKTQLHFAADEAAFKPLIFTDTVQTVDLEIGNEKFKAILQDVQYHPISDKILHVDFLEINESKPVIIGIPIQITGTAPGVREGGKLIKKQRKLKVKALLNNLPDTIQVDISSLGIGNSVRIKDLTTPNVTFLDGGNIEVVAVSATRASRQAEESK
jgi:large subunit ribosomal protein L25